ncbi:HAD family hydrolase [Halochromatium glycolicum]|jgi:HAD superfamily hydrolase (TIGR01490 family)|uniref:Histidinol-phosphatase n=1 Tax=Halochromatium glycolicum TaxID=85075 RepID=A0AAJ0XBU8_9GAMM|nr:HAD family hydrolase [Halochromatium glycolicum]MBK1706327.1 phosphoserine phosphatase [Halochromatium glycolicum]
MPLALFDLDNTLLAGDSDYLWGRHLIDLGIVDAEAYEHANQRFYDDYRNGCLDIDAFLRFSLAPLSQHPMADLERWREDFVRRRIDPIILPAARELVEQHRRAGDTLMIITATNAFVTSPIAARFGVDQLIATEPAIEAGRYTGRVEGTPAFREGKVERLRDWLERHDATLTGSVFYSDSINDLPLLETVEQAVAIDPDERLAAIARQRGWSIRSLRG